MVNTDEGTNLAKWTATYTPTANINNVTDSVSFSVVNSNNNTGESNIATVSIEITPVNDAPLLVPVYPELEVKVAQYFVASGATFSVAGQA